MQNMARVAWSELSPAKYEQMVAVLVRPSAPDSLARTYRMIVPRVEAVANGQEQLPGVGFLHFAIISDREGDGLELEADHRQPAVIEHVIRDLKRGLALNHSYHEATAADPEQRMERSDSAVNLFS
jgi:hypothetical protein